MKPLLIAAGVLLAAAAISLIPRRAPGPRLPSFAPDKVQKLEIKHPFETVVLEKKDGRWNLSAPRRYPANEAAVVSFLASLNSLSAGSALTERAESHGIYEISDSSGTAVGVWEDPAKEPARWVFGKMAADRVHIYLRLPPGPGVFPAQGVRLNDLQRFSTEWREKRVLVLEDGEDIVGWNFRKRGGAGFSAVKTSETWTVDGRPADGAPLTQALDALRILAAEDFIDIDQPSASSLKDLGLDPPQAVHAVFLSSGRTIEIKIGKPNLGRQQTPVQRGQEWTLFWIEDNVMAGLPSTPKDLAPVQ